MRLKIIIKKYTRISRNYRASRNKSTVSLFTHGTPFLLAQQSAVSSENLDVTQKRNGPCVSLFRENSRKCSRPMIACESERKGDSSLGLKIRHRQREGHRENQKRSRDPANKVRFDKASKRQCVHDIMAARWKSGRGMVSALRVHATRKINFLRNNESTPRVFERYPGRIYTSGMQRSVLSFMLLSTRPCEKKHVAKKCSEKLWLRFVTFSQWIE